MTRMALRCVCDAVGLALGVLLVWQVWLNGWFAEDCLCCGGPLFASPVPSAWALSLTMIGLPFFGLRYWWLGRCGRYGAWMQWPYAVILAGLLCAPLSSICLGLLLVVIVVGESLPTFWQMAIDGLPKARLAGLVWGLAFVLLAGVLWLVRKVRGVGQGRRSRMLWVALAFAFGMACLGVPDLVAFERWRVALCRRPPQQQAALSPEAWGGGLPPLVSRT